MSYNHILFSSSKDSLESYQRIFAEKPPENVLVFMPEGQGDIPSGLREAADGATIIPWKVESLDIDYEQEWIAAVVETKPPRILMQMIEGLTQSNLNQDNLVVTIFSGSKLHATLLFTFALIFDAEVHVLQGESDGEQELIGLEWLKGALHSMNNKKLQQGVLLGMLYAKNSEYSTHLLNSNHNEEKPYSPNEDGWLSAESIVGSQPPDSAPDPKGFASTASAMCKANLLERKLDPSSNNKEQRYRLSGKGWIAALSLWNQQNDEGIGSMYGRISGVMINPKSDNLNAISIMNTLERVDCWITLFGMIGGNEEIYNNALEKWNDAIHYQEITHSHWKLSDTSNNIEHGFTDLCEWLWPRLESMKTTWTLDLTQLILSTQLIPAVLFAQSVGLPMTYCMPRRGNSNSPDSGVSPRPNLGRLSHVLSLPNRDLLPVFLENQSQDILIKHKILLNLLHHERYLDAQTEAARLALRDDPCGEIPENLQPKDTHLTYIELKEFIDEEIKNGSISEDLALPMKPNATPIKYLRSARLITFRKRSGRGSAEEMQISTTGKILSLLIESQSIASEGDADVR
jgi:hypothetical protein